MRQNGEKRRQAVDTRKKILKTALKLFVEKGFAEVSINDLIQEVGIAKGGFYHHFKSKDQLINEIIEKVIFPYLDDIINSIDKCQGSAKEKLFHAFEKQSQAETFLKTNFHVDNISNRSLIILMIECIKRYESMSAHVIEFTEQLLGRIESIIEEGKRRGELLNTIDSKSLSLYIVSSLEGALFIWVMNPKTDLKMLFENNFQYVWSSIKN
ncbi:MAG TPA: TetR/AcrR family transcriptional regulator [Desulfitobacteriaceae bacterium]|nr:TetR/AcrR family transcriptional regulator [Desulfitobacteriaceae bacterium]